MQGLKWMLALAVMVALATPVLAQEKPATTAAAVAAPAGGEGLSKGLAILGLSVGAGLAVIGGARGISAIGAGALDGIARQPEAAGSMFMAWLLPAAMIEGAMLFAVLVCMMALSKA